MEWIFEPSAWVALVTLTFLEVVLGIDNIVFLSILTGRLPVEQQPRARRIGLLLAMGMRVGLLFAISWVMGLHRELFAVFGHGFSGRDLILLGGGLFLMWKSVSEIHHKLEGDEAKVKAGGRPGAVSVRAIVTQIALIDMVFSLDSVITAVGMARHLAVMVIAVMVSVGVMMLFVDVICAFVERHPTVKMLALSFLLLIGFTLTSEAFHVAIPHGYIYFAMAFSVGVEVLNLKLRKVGEPVALRGPEPPRPE